MASENCREEFVTSERFVLKNVCTMYEFMQRGEHCDVDIILDNKCYPVHKIVMLASSEYFRSQTWIKQINSENPKVTLTNIPCECLEWVIHFCYTGSIEFKNSTIDDMMSAASYLGNDDLIDIGLDYWLKHISVQNCIMIATFAHFHEKLDVQKISFDFCCKNFNDLVKTDEFLASDYN
ncbi:kelch-like protein 1 isoform X1 [Arctopsyche grandis]|uniref:kelch-like protein 1 isoform X1 n=1 Tax=Arctopsyche grandis TaxID=121162 RepID=UPI00406D8068